MPKTNIEFWQDKIAANIKRDKTNQGDLVKLGWQVLVVWECDIKKNVHEVANRIMLACGTLKKSAEGARSGFQDDAL